MKKILSMVLVALFLVSPYAISISCAENTISAGDWMFVEEVREFKTTQNYPPQIYAYGTKGIQYYAGFIPAVSVKHYGRGYYTVTYRGKIYPSNSNQINGLDVFLNNQE